MQTQDIFSNVEKISIRLTGLLKAGKLPDNLLAQLREGLPGFRARFEQGEQPQDLPAILNSASDFLSWLEQTPDLRTWFIAMHINKNSALF